MKVESMTNLQLNWAVATCAIVGFTVSGAGPYARVIYIPKRSAWMVYSPTTNWKQGGAVIEAARITVEVKHDGWWVAMVYDINDAPQWMSVGETPLVAAMRCYVKSKFGDALEPPAGLSAFPL